MTYVMLTCPRKYIPAGKMWKRYFDSIDSHKWIIALEHGKGGLEHWQIRFQHRAETKEEKAALFNQLKMHVPEAHIQFTTTWCDYERKEGNFVCSDDSREVLAVRFGVPTHQQREMLYRADAQGSRSIDVYYDKQGSHGKSWLSIHTFERGLALLVPRYCNSARSVSNYICSAYCGQKYIIIDLPRSAKIQDDLYEILEEIKDGIVFDERYSGKMRNIRGARLLVFTNKLLDKKRLSKDRWNLHGMVEFNATKLEENRRGKCQL